MIVCAENESLILKWKCHAACRYVHSNRETAFGLCCHGHSVVCIDDVCLMNLSLRKQNYWNTQKSIVLLLIDPSFVCLEILDFLFAAVVTGIDVSTQ